MKSDTAALVTVGLVALLALGYATRKRWMRRSSPAPAPSGSEYVIPNAAPPGELMRPSAVDAFAASMRPDKPAWLNNYGAGFAAGTPIYKGAAPIGGAPVEYPWKTLHR